VSKVPHIVIIDDDGSVRDATSNLLRALGYSVAVFSSAEEFLKSNTIQNASCLITDVQMPGMSGVEFQQHVLAAGHRTPIIIMTACPTDALRARVMQKGAVGFLTKPLCQQELLTALDRVLNLAR
jgi:FixJ family two-component response regulator